MSRPFYAKGINSKARAFISMVGGEINHEPAKRCFIVTLPDDVRTDAMPAKDGNGYIVGEQLDVQIRINEKRSVFLLKVDA